MVEKYFLEVLPISRLEQRISCMIFRGMSFHTPIPHFISLTLPAQYR